MAAEHAWEVHTAREFAAAWGHCTTCLWDGPLRWTTGEASADAALHADQMARMGEGDDGR